MSEMTRGEREKKAKELLEQAEVLRGQAWQILVDDATDEEIRDAVRGLNEQYQDLGEEMLDDSGTKAYALLEWREWQRENREVQSEGE